MKFFFPSAAHDVQAEYRYRMLCEQLAVTVPQKRIFRIRYHHRGKTMVAAVGEQPDGLYRCPSEHIMAILPGNPYLICTPSRGILPRQKAPIYIGPHALIEIEYFQQRDTDRAGMQPF